MIRASQQGRSHDRILFAATVPGTLDKFMRGQLRWLVERGHEVHVAATPGSALEALRKREGVLTHPLPMAREIAPVADLKSLVDWVRLLRRIRPDVVVVSTPKAGLLGGLASLVCRIPRRIYLLRGARFEGEVGARRRLLAVLERISCATAHCVIAVSPSLARLVQREGIVRSPKVTVVESGSSNGVDLQRFHPPSPVERGRARAAWGLGQDTVAILYLGRLHPDKGLDMLQASLAVMESCEQIRVVVMLAGRDEGAEVLHQGGGTLEVRRLGQVDHVPELLHAADILVLPTQREGFPNVVLEAAASGLPVVTTDATGAVDSVVQGVTGFVVAKDDSETLGLAMRELAMSKHLRRRFGHAARIRAEREFSAERIWRGMYSVYLGTCIPPVPD